MPEGFSPAVYREACLRVDLPLRGARSHQRGELLHVPAGHGRSVFGGILGEPGRSVCAEYHLLVVLDGAPSHTSGQIALPENVSLMRLPAYSPELNPVERWFQEFRRALSNRVFETVELLQEALTATLEPYWRDPARLRSLAGFSWWMEAIESLGHQPP